MQRLVVALGVSAFALAACGRADAPAAAPEPPAAATAVPQHAAVTEVKALDKKKFGAAITEATTTPLDDLAKEPARYAQKTVRTEGMVSAVCEHRGCWMEIADEAGNAHIKMAGHSFFVPRDVKGHHAVVQGKVLPREGDECTEEAEKTTGEIAKVQIEANGVELVD